MKIHIKEFLLGMATATTALALITTGLKHNAERKEAQQKTQRRDSLSKRWRDSVQLVMERKEDSTIEATAIYDHSRIPRPNR